MDLHQLHVLHTCTTICWFVEGVRMFFKKSRMCKRVNRYGKTMWKLVFYLKVHTHTYLDYWHTQLKHNFLNKGEHSVLVSHCGIEPSISQSTILSFDPSSQKAYYESLSMEECWYVFYQQSSMQTWTDMNKQNEFKVNFICERRWSLRETTNEVIACCYIL